MKIMNKNVFVFIFGILLFSGAVSANIIGTIGMQGLSFVNPQLAQVVQGILCVTSPGGIAACAVQYAQGKVIGQIKGEIFNKIAQADPEAAKAILTYNQVNGYIEQGAAILKELKVNEEGKIEEGVLHFNEKEYSLKEFLVDSNAEDIVVSNADYDFKANKLTMKKDGYMKLKFKDENGAEKEFVYKYIKEGGKFILNEKGEIKAAQFISSENNAVFEFPGLDKLTVEEDTEILYQDGKVLVKGKKFLYGDNLIETFGNFGKFAEIEGNSIICVDCKVGDVYLKNLGGVPASASILDKGILVNYGEVNYKQNKFAVGEANSVFVANPGVDMSGYQGNWIRQTSDILEIQSSKTGNGIGIEFLENHEILNTDNKDLLQIGISHGDGFVFEKRENQFLIPKLTHKSSENGVTLIKNDNIDFIINKDGIESLWTTPLYKGDFSGKYQSVAFELYGSLKNGGKLRVDSHSLFALVDENNFEIVINSNGLPVSASIADNELQTIEQLREKYPNIEFYIPEFREGDPKEDGYLPIMGNSLNITGVSPYHVYVIKCFLEKYPDAVNKINTIGFVNLYNAGVFTSGSDINLYVGDKVINIYGTNSVNVRGITNPLDVLYHEFIHVKDQFYGIEESQLMKNEPYFNEEIEKINKFIEKRDFLMILLDNEKDKENEKEISEKIKELNEEIKKLDSQIKEKWYEKNPDNPLLMQIYNQMALEAQKEVLEHRQNFVELMEEYSKNQESESFKKYLPALKSYVKKRYDKDFNSFLKENNPYNINKNSEIDLNPSDFVLLLNDVANNIPGSLYLDDDYLVLDDAYNYLSGLRTLKLNLEEEQGKKFFDAFYEVDGKISESSSHFRKHLETITGIPYAYAFTNYEKSEHPANAYFAEMSAVFWERPISKLISCANSENSIIRNYCRKMTQIGFDSSQIDKDEYKKIMGNYHCESGDCLDKLCIEYKLLCCQKYPASPNCK